MPNIIIVTITYNDKVNLLRTFTSIRKYKKSYHRYIVIDGNSSDGTADTIADNSDIINDYLIEPDKGIYDAMNKVLLFNMSENDFVLWLNSGDELLDWKGIDLEKLAVYEGAFYAVVAKMNETSVGKIISPHIFVPYNEKNFYPKSRYMHQGFIIKKRLFESLKYDLSIGLQAENLLMSQCILNKSYYVSNYPLANFYMDGVSNSEFKLILISYLKVTKALNFSISKIFFYQFWFLFKTTIKIFLPFNFILFLRKYKAK